MAVRSTAIAIEKREGSRGKTNPLFANINEISGTRTQFALLLTRRLVPSLSAMVHPSPSLLPSSEHLKF